MTPSHDAPPTGPLVVLGPTASGKSDVAMAFAGEHADIEIVAVDAMQVYRGMDIGTAKPTPQDRALVPHHCLDLVDPSEDFSLPQFTSAAATAIADIDRRGATPLLVAGTGLYLRALTDPMDVPGTWPDIRRDLEQRAVVDGTERLHEELAATDPTAASRMEPGNTRRVVRALEVVLGSGRLFSSYGPGIASFGETRFRMLGLRWPRALLHARIEARVSGMLDRGLVAEMRRLHESPQPLSRTARQALGYKELIDHLEGRCSLDDAVETIVTRTRQFAVRQERWFRRDPRIVWVEVGTNPVAESLPVLRDLARR